MSIKRISEMTGISSATVARALSGNGYCSKEKFDIIMAAARELDYHPNLSARALRNNHTEKILMGIPDMCNSFYFRMIEGITEELDKYGYYLMIFNTQHILKKEKKLLDLLSQKYADGLIFVSFNFNEEIVEEIRKTNLPVVLTNRYEGIRKNDNFDFVYSDHILGMEMLTEHVVKTGHQHILLIAGSNEEQTSRERIQGYKTVLARHNIPIREEYILNGGFEARGAYEAFKGFIQKNLPIDAVIVASDVMYMGCMRYIMETKFPVDNIAFATFDNTDFSAQFGVTSLDLKQEEIGRHAVRLIMERINDGRKISAQEYITPKLVIR